MIMSDFKEFPQVGRVLGVDWGQRRVGVAISDESREFFFARPQIENKPWSRAAVAAVADMASEEKAVGIVIGLPLRFDGSESETTAAVRLFAKDLASYIDLPIIFIDETLQDLIASNASMHVLKDYAISQGTQFLRDDVIRLIKEGVTSVDEARKILFSVN